MGGLWASSGVVVSEQCGAIAARPPSHSSGAFFDLVATLGDGPLVNFLVVGVSALCGVSGGAFEEKVVVSLNGGGVDSVSTVRARSESSIVSGGTPSPRVLQVASLGYQLEGFVSSSRDRDNSSVSDVDGGGGSSDVDGGTSKISTSSNADSLASIIPASSSNLAENMSVGELDGNTSDGGDSVFPDWNVVNLDFKVVVSVPETGYPVVSELHGFVVSG